MSPHLFDEFLASSDTLRVYEDDKLLFSSSKDRLAPLLEYLGKFAPCHRPVVIFDRITGNAAALLCILAGCSEVYSPLGSGLAIETLERYGIKYHFTQLVPYIQKTGGQNMCPMEKLSLDKLPEEFYQLMRNMQSK